MGRCDLLGPKILKIRAILAIFRLFEDFQFLAVHDLFIHQMLRTAITLKKIAIATSGAIAIVTTAAAAATVVVAMAMAVVSGASLIYH